MIINAAIRTHGGTEPPTCDLSFVRNEDRRLSLVVRGVPSGLTITKLVWTGQDAAGAQTFQKVITLASSLATIGQITDAGTLGVARATASFTPSDTVNWPATASHQLWAVLSDGNPYRCLTGTVRSATPVPLTLTTVASLTFAPSPVSISGSPGTTQSVTVTAKDAGGAAVVGVSIALASNDTGVVTVSPASAVTDASGVATFTLTLVATGSTTVTASVGAISASDTVTTTSSNPNLPPAAQDALVLAWDAQRGTVLGPAYQLGSTPGADTNDPTFVAGPPACYQFAATSYITWGDVLDTTWAGASGWTTLSAIGLSAADVAATVSALLSKDDSSAARELFLGALSGKLRWNVFYGGGSANYEQVDLTAAMAVGRHVVGFGFDPSLARAARIQPYVDGAPATAAYTGVGVDGTIADTTQPLQAGFWAGTWPGPDTQRALYVYNRPLTAQEHSDNRAWIVADGWS